MTTLDCSGAPPILLPVHLAMRWRGITDVVTGNPVDLNMDEPRTDYDRACVAARKANGQLRIDEHDCLVIYTESDGHVWLGDFGVVMCGYLVPRLELLQAASWNDPLIWRCSESNPILLNSAADAAQGLEEGEDYVHTSIRQGLYRVETALLSDGEHDGIAHRFTFLGTDEK